MLPTILGTVDVVVWSWLLTCRGGFWRSGPVLGMSPAPPTDCRVTIVVPARDEAEHIQQTLHSLLAQSFPGTLNVVLVDDGSTDSTAHLAQTLADREHRLHIISGAPLPPGWTGKLWAVPQGLAQPEAQVADFVLLTDADIVHAPQHLAALVGKAPHDTLNLVSEMVALRVETLAERSLIPAFVFFFQMLYPFSGVADPRRPEAAAAGGTMLLSRAALDRIGGVHRIRSALIDDVALAREVKRGVHRIWLGHAEQAWSPRSYPVLLDVTRMIARTAYVQLGYSPPLLATTIAGLGLVYVGPVALTLRGRHTVPWLGAASWTLMAIAFQPTFKRCRRSPLWGLALPAIALVYAGATVASATQFYRGQGIRWKDRIYPAGTPTGS
jgi:hopene-associated glycosyltransferase HpnB